MRVFARILMAAIAWGVLAFGAVYPWAYWPLIVAAAGLGGWALWRTREAIDPRARWLLNMAAAVVAAIAIQIIALPYSWLSVMSPGVDRFLRDFSLVYHPASLHSLSLAPEQTVIALCLAAALALLLVGLVKAFRLLPIDWFGSQVMGLGVAFSLIGIIQASFFQPNDQVVTVYGFWRTEQGGNPFGSFINRNHYAGWMIMATPLVIGYSVAIASGSLRSGRDFMGWLTSQHANKFLLVASSSLIMATSIALTDSRSGIAAFGLSLTVLGYFLIASVKKRRTKVIVASYLVAMLIGGLLWAGPSQLINRFGRSKVDAKVGRFNAWKDTLAIARDFPIFGSGIGSYGRAMMVYQSAGRDVMYAQAHNDYLQLLAEGGALVVVPALGLFGVFVAGVRRRLRLKEDDTLTYWLRRGAIAGLVGIAAQSVVEFSLQMPGNALLFVVMAAIAFHRPRRQALPNAHRV